MQCRSNDAGETSNFRMRKQRKKSLGGKNEFVDHAAGSRPATGAAILESRQALMAA